MQPAQKSAPREEVVTRQLGCVDYATTYNAMQRFTDTRTPATGDEIWLLEHPPVYTMGLKGRDGTRTHIRNIPLVYTDRGGDITYHGPGQIVVYMLVDLRRRGGGPKHLVSVLEQSVIDLLAGYRIAAERRAGAPGVYVAGAKIAALGLRMRRGASYHGLALNVDMDLAPFSGIDPCGYPGLAVTSLAKLGVRHDTTVIGRQLVERLISQLGYTAAIDSSAGLPGGST